MPPVEIDGNPITGATIDGTDVQEITVDGDTVFTAAPPIIEDFEDGNINGWNHTTGAGGTADISNIGFNSNHSIKVNVTTGGTASVAYFDSLGTKNFTQNYVLSAYLRLGQVNNSVGSIGYIYNTSDTQDVLACGLNNDENLFFIQYNDIPNGVGAQASTSFNSSSGIWYELELEFDGSDHIGRLYDDNGTLLETLTWASSSAQAENSAYVATMQASWGAVAHENFADDFRLSI